ncbi:uncharacterized protein LOC124295541 [Neodiprion lecontei]|uniref:Uncharacterized protein LOC124295541 n=1 Tax=Neodiprion lecontei TaxID=441921 RepID=A0ABM3GNQ8_NEOLC|nr:uncharacterized protein LOC124295541 [Neodiprion lecontei]
MTVGTSGLTSLREATAKALEVKAMRKQYFGINELRRVEVSKSTSERRGFEPSEESKPQNYRMSKKFFDTQHLKLEPAFNADKAANINKLANLINNKKRPTSNPIDSTFENWTVNLSNTEIPVNVTDVLKMGFKYGIPFEPHCIPTNKLISDFESKISFIPPDRRNTARQDFTNTIKKFINTPSSLHADKNILHKIKETKIFQNNNQDLLFLKADKGNTTVVMNKQMYEDKMLQQLSNNNSYKVVRYNLTCTLQQEVKKLTTDWS